MDLTKIKDLLVETAQKAGDYIFEESKQFSQKAVEYKDINNVVSYVDKTAEQIIVDSLKDVLPNAGFITEEGTADTDNIEGYNWIIDPLDGTANFIHGLPHYSVSIALAKGKEVLVGVVYNVCTKEMYNAIKGNGAYKNGIKLSVSKAHSLNESLLATGFPYYKFEEMKQYIQILESLMQKTHGLRRFGSAALDLAFVAEGRYEGFFEYNLQSYDMAAGVLLVQEAGGFVTDFKGESNYLFGGDVVAAGAVHKELLSEIMRFWK